MKKILNLIITGLFLISFLNITVAQDNIIYNMSNLHQSINDNPAHQTNCKVYIGLPVLTHTYLDFVGPFTFKDIFTEQANGKYGNIDQIYENLDDVNYINFESNIALFKLGFWIKDFYITTGINNRIYDRTSFPKSILDLRDGNYRADGTPISFSGFGEDFTAYNEIQFGISNEIIPKLTVGLNAKLLFGIANFSTEQFKVDWYTDTDPEGNFAYTFDTEFEFRTSTPLYWDATYDEITDLPNGISYDSLWVENLEKNATDSILQYLLPKQNFGLGIDLGAVYEINDYFTVSASLIDFGFIKWKRNPKIITQNAEFEFTGADPAPYIESLEQIVDSFSVIIDEYSSDFLDTLIGLAKPTFTNKAYKTSLNAKFFIGGTYHPKDWLDLGLLYRGYFWEKKLHSAITLSVTANFWKGWSAATSYSIYNGLYNNFGLGLAYKIGPFQFYSVADNIALPFFVLNDTKISNRWIKNTKEVSLHFGFNLLFGCRNKVDYGVLD
jgi:hypothetical protein